MKTVLIVLVLLALCELTAALYISYITIFDPMSWKDAQKYCRGNYSDLATIGTDEVISQLTSEINDFDIIDFLFGNAYGQAVWVGLNRIFTTNWQWSDDIKYLFNIQVQDMQRFQCAKMENSQFYDSDCEDILPFICYEWEPKLILVREKKSWEEALQYCRTHHTDLASLPSYYHLIQFNQTTVNSETLSVWTGLRFLSGSWFWVSGEDLETWFQLPACPDNYMYCGSHNRETKSWENRDCTEKLNFVCY